MEKIKAQLKKSVFYYWIVLVLLPAITNAVPASEIRGRIKEIVISLFVGLVVIYMLGQAGEVPNIGLNVYTFLAWLLVTFLLRFVLNFFSIPARLHFALESQSNKLSFKDVEFTEYYFKSDSGIGKGAGLKLTSHKRVQDYISTFSAKITWIRRSGEAVYSDSLPLGVARAVGTSDMLSIVWDGGDLTTHEIKLLCLAKREGSRAWIPAKRVDGQVINLPLDNDTNYQLTLEFFGKLDETELDLQRCAVFCDVIYNSIQDNFMIKIMRKDLP